MNIYSLRVMLKTGRPFAGAMADEALTTAWQKAEKAILKGKGEAALKILRELDADGNEPTTLRLAGHATWLNAKARNSRSEYRKAATLLREAVKKAPRDKKADSTYNDLLNEMQEKGFRETTIPRLLNDGTPTPAGIAAIFIAGLLLLAGINVASSTSQEGLPTEATLSFTWTNNDGSAGSGDVVVELFAADAPIHVENFALLAQDEKYDGVIFHRVIKDFMMQGGDFTNGDGTGGHAGKFFGYCNGQESNSAGDCDKNSYTIEDEADNGRVHNPYHLSMAKTSAPHTGGSQFFIVDPDAVSPDGTPGTPHLDGVHTVFGQVTDGFEHIDAMSSICDAPTACQNDKPNNDITLVTVEVAGEYSPWYKFW